MNNKMQNSHVKLGKNLVSLYKKKREMDVQIHQILHLFLMEILH